MNNPFYIILSTLIQILSFVIIADALLSFFLPPHNAIREALGRILNPIYQPIRRVLPPLGGLDLTPLAVLLILQLISRLLVRLF